MTGGKAGPMKLDVNPNPQSLANEEIHQSAKARGDRQRGHPIRHVIDIPRSLAGTW